MLDGKKGEEGREVERSGRPTDPLPSRHPPPAPHPLGPEDKWKTQCFLNPLNVRLRPNPVMSPSVRGGGDGSSGPRYEGGGEGVVSLRVLTPSLIRSETFLQIDSLLPTHTNQDSTSTRPQTPTHDSLHFSSHPTHVPRVSSWVLVRNRTHL